MKNLSNNLRKVFFALVIATGFLSFTNLNAANINNSGLAVVTSAIPDCPTCSNEAVYSDSENKIEGWMSSNAYWGTMNVLEAIEMENSIPVENWMSSNNFWGSINATESIEKDGYNLVENWMGSNNYWTSGLAIEAEQLESDVKLNVEKWMTDNTLWNTK